MRVAGKRNSIGADGRATEVSSLVSLKFFPSRNDIPMSRSIISSSSFSLPMFVAGLCDNNALSTHVLTEVFQ